MKALSLMKGELTVDALKKDMEQKNVAKHNLFTPEQKLCSAIQLETQIKPEVAVYEGGYRGTLYERDAKEPGCFCCKKYACCYCCCCKVKCC